MSVIAVSIAVAGACLFSPGTAVAQSVGSGTFSITSDPGDPIGRGLSFSYDTTAGDRMSVFGLFGNSGVIVQVDSADGNFWDLRLSAAEGQALAPGTYTAPSGDPSAPAIGLTGNGTSCGGSPGSFTINTMEWAPHDYVQALDATFEQHCGGFEPATRGHMHIANPPPPPDLALGLTVATDGTADLLNGNATLHGTVSCNKAANVSINGTLTQDNKGFIARGTYFKELPCTPGDPIAWTMTVVPSDAVAFQKGDAHATTKAGAFDTDSGIFATADNTAVVSLSKTR